MRPETTELKCINQTADMYFMLPKILLVLFPLLLLFHTRLGFAVLAIAIVLLYIGNVKAAKPHNRSREVDNSL